MYEPTYSYNDSLVSTLIKIEQNKVNLQNIDLSYNLRQKLLQKLKVLDIFHAANSLKLEMTLRDAEKIALGQSLESVDEIRSILLKNIRQTLEFNRSNVADTYSELDKSVVLHINKIMLNQWRETWEGNFRSFTDKVEDRWDNLFKFHDPNIPSGEIENEVENLIDWYKLSIPTVPAVVRIAIVFYRLVQIAPFTAANKFTIISIIDYLMMRNNFGVRAHTSVIRMIDYQDEKFERIFEMVKKAYDLTFFIDTFAQALLEELLDAREEVNEFMTQEEKSKQQPFLNLNKRQLKILKYLQNVPTIKREDYCHMMDVSTMTAFRDLNDLVRKKLLKLEGKGRGTKYKLASM